MFGGITVFPLMFLVGWLAWQFARGHKDMWGHRDVGTTIFFSFIGPLMTTFVVLVTSTITVSFADLHPVAFNEVALSSITTDEFVIGDAGEFYALKDDKGKVFHVTKAKDLEIVYDDVDSAAYERIKYMTDNAFVRFMMLDDGEDDLIDRHYRLTLPRNVEFKNVVEEVIVNLNPALEEK